MIKYFIILFVNNCFNYFNIDKYLYNKIIPMNIRSLQKI